MSKIELILGDCLEEMKKIPDKSIDLIVTSPPYNQNLTTQDKTKFLYNDNKNSEDYNNWLKEIFNELYRILKLSGSFLYNYKTQVSDNILSPAFQHINTVNNQFLLVGEIVWKYAGNFDSCRKRFPVDYEMFYHFAKKNDFYFNDCGETLTSVWNIKHVMAGSAEKKQAGEHPCPYPVTIIKKIIRHCCPQGGVVLDPFMGSGSALVASKEEKRNAIGIEIEPKYFEIAKRRIDQAQELLFI